MHMLMYHMRSKDMFVSAVFNVTRQARAQLQRTGNAGKQIAVADAEKATALLSMCLTNPDRDAFITEDDLAHLSHSNLGDSFHELTRLFHMYQHHSLVNHTGGQKISEDEAAPGVEVYQAHVKKNGKVANYGDASNTSLLIRQLVMLLGTKVAV